MLAKIKTETRADLLLALILAACAAAIMLLRAPLWGSLWLDELVSFWVIKDGAEEALKRSFEFQAQSPLYYLVLSLWRDFFGSSELALRSLSILFFVLTLGLCAEFARRFHSTCAVLPSLLVLCSISSMQVTAISARPYSMAIFMSLASFYFFVMLLRQSSALCGVGYVLATLLTFWTHYIFALIVLIQFLIWGVMSFRNAGKYFGCQLLIATGMLPALPHLQKIAERQTLYDQTLLGAGSNIYLAWFSLNLIVPILVAVLCAAFFSRIEWQKSRLDKRILVALMIWAFLPPLLSKLLSLLTGSSLDLERYYLFYAPGFALLVGYLFSLLGNRASLLAGLVLCLMFFVAESKRSFVEEDWRAVTRSANQILAVNYVPVLSVPGLVEAGSELWLNAPERLQYLMAPFSYYPLATNPFLLPLSTDKDLIKKFIGPKLREALHVSKEFILILPNYKLGKAPDSKVSLKSRYQEVFSELGFESRDAEKGTVLMLRFFEVKS